MRSDLQSALDQAHEIREAFPEVSVYIMHDPLGRNHIVWLSDTAAPRWFENKRIIMAEEVKYLLKVRTILTGGKM